MLLAVVVLASAIVAMALRGASHSPPARLEPPVSVAEAEAAASAASADTPQRSAVGSALVPNESAAHTGQYTVVDQEGKPVPEAFAYTGKIHDRWVHGRALAQSDFKGKLQLPSDLRLEAGEVLVCWAQGFTSKPLEKAKGGVITLERGETLVGHASNGNGRPVAGLRVIASRASLLPLQSMEMVTRPGIPSSGHDAIHVALTGEDGLFELHGLPKGKYSLEYQHESKCVVDTGLGKETCLSVPHPRLEVILSELYCASIRVEGAEIATLSMQYPTWSAKGATAARSIGHLLQRMGLQSGWNRTGATYYMSPGKTGAPENGVAQFVLFFAKSPMMVIDVPARPVKDNYVHLVRASTGNGMRSSAQTKFALCDARGVSLAGLEVYLVRTTEAPDGRPLSESYTATDGASVELPYGEFTVSTSHPILTRLINPPRVAVNSPVQQVNIYVTQPVQPVRVSCRDFVRGECQVRIVGSDKKQATSKFVRDGDSPVFWLPRGSYAVYVDRFGCKRGAATFDVAGGEPTLDVSVPELEADS